MRVTRWDPRRNIQTAHISISQNGRSQQEIHVQRAYPVAMVVDLLTRAQFHLLGVLDFRTLDLPGSGTARAIYIAGKGK